MQPRLRPAVLEEVVANRLEGCRIDKAVRCRRCEHVGDFLGPIETFQENCGNRKQAVKGAGGYEETPAHEAPSFNRCGRPGREG